MVEFSNGVNKKIIIRSALGILILLFSILSWYLIKNSFVQAQSEEWVAMILFPSLSFIALGSFIGLSYLLEDDWKFLSGMMLLVAAPFFVFFNSFSIYKAGLVVVAFIFLCRGIYHVLREKKIKIKIVLAEILMKGLGPVITGLALLAAISFFGSAYAQSSATSEIIVPRDFFNKIIDPLLSAPEAIKNLSAAQRTPEMAQKTAQESESLEDSIYQQVNKYLNTTGNSFKKFLPFGLATSFFFAVRIWGAILMRLAAMLAWVWFGVLRLFKVARIASISVEKEIIELE